MKKLWANKEYLVFGIVILLFIFVSIMAVSSIRLLQGNARVVNYVGIVRGATQKLIKEEIMGWELSRRNSDFAELSSWYPNDALVTRLDSIVEELLTGKGPNELVVLQDATYLANMRHVQEHWIDLKVLIKEVRSGDNPLMLFESSQKYFDLVDKTVFSAETFSEAQVNRITTVFVTVIAIFILLIVVGLILYMRGLAVKRRADALGKIAYVDSLTGLSNRTSCEQLINRIEKSPPDDNLAVFMFDMNDLKLTNDFFGHQGGDRIIVAFAKALAAANEAEGFIGRFGGDEFLAVFEPGDKEIAERYLSNIRKLVDSYNQTQTNKLETIQYAAGYVIASAKERHIDDIIHEADNMMYASKRKLKGLL